MQTLRPYHPDGYSQIINLFFLNTPKYVCMPEQQDLEEYLKEEDGIILETGGCNIVSCSIEG